MKTYRPRAPLFLLFGIVLPFLAAGLTLSAGDGNPQTQQRLIADVKFLASDELEGRGIGSKGLNLAADYIRDQFAKAGLKLDAINGGPFQSFAMQTDAELGPSNTLELTGPDNRKISLTLKSDFLPQSFGESGAFSGGLAFCGYGIESPDNNYDDFAGLDLKGKVAVLLRRVPDQANPRSKFAGRHGAISSHGDLRSKVGNAHAHGAAAILLVNDPYSSRQELEQGQKQVANLAKEVAEAAVEFEATDPNDVEKYAAARKKLSTEAVRYKSGKAHLGSDEPDTLMKFGYASTKAFRNIPVLHITRAAADLFLKPALGKTVADLEAAIDKDVKPQSALIPGWNVSGTVTIERKSADVKNVIAVLEGTGPLANETIVVGAHYDHVGRGGPGSLLPGSTDVHNGADDNASGTAALLELARRLSARRQKLSRRIVFIAFTGEESGLIGSAQYTSEPVFPLDKTVAMLNMDMVGRLKEEKLTVFGTGTAPIWEGLLNEHARDLGFDVTFKPEGFGPSDHSSFYAKQIPVLHLFTGNHSDYHRPSDDWEKINIPGIERVVDLMERLTVRIAETSERPQYVAVKGTADISAREGARPYFGSIPDFGAKMPGYALAGVSPGGPADKGGLKAGDIIIQLGMVKIENLEDFDLALRRFIPGDTVSVTVMRGMEKVTVRVTLDKPRG
jgi:Peptidase family M28/PDZ domain/PA domain